MTQIDDNATVAYYGHGAVWDSIRNALDNIGKDKDQLEVDDLIAVDAFHIRGRTATAELSNRAGINRDQTVLDVGCGIGGSVRYLANKYGCKTTGIDVTREYIEVADHLARLIRLGDLIEFHHASALDMPFGNATFDIAWTEHAQMNIPEKEQFYGEIARVVKPGGQLVFHDVFSGTGGDPYYPVPWAEEANISHLASVSQLRGYLDDAGFTIDYWEDKSQDALDWFQARVARTRKSGPSPLGIHLLLGRTTKDKFKNIIRNLSERRIRTIQAVATKT